MTIQKFEEFRALAPNASVAAALAENLEGEKPTIADFTKINVPGAGGLSFVVPTISGDSDEKSLTGIVVHIQTRRAYWAESMDVAGGGSPPDCTSNDGEFGTGDPGGECLTCPMNQWQDAGGKPCGEQRLIFLLRPGDMLPIMIQAPPTSLAAVRKYRLALTNLNVPISKVITEISLARTKSKGGINYSQLQFKSVGEVPAELWERIDSYSEAIKGFLS